MSKRGLYRFRFECGRMGHLSGLFTATEDEVKAAIGRDLYFGEVLGKHSEIFGPFDEGDVALVTDDEAFVSKFDEYGCASGFNPLKYFREEEEETEEES